MNKPLISVIIPVYKTEKYLDRCVSSVVNQTYENLEIILVDDGSPDRCPEMCDEWAAKDPRIKVIHKKNGGLSDARNVALDVMKGDYVTFIDSDDWVSLRYVEVLYEGIVRNNAYISVVGYKRVKDCETISNVLSGEYKVIDSAAAIKELYGKDQIMFVTAWGKLIARSIITSIRFPVGKLHEDDFTTYKLYHSSGRISVSYDRMYAYYVNEGSIISNYSLRRLDALDAQLEKFDFVRDKYPQLETLAMTSYFGSCRYHFQRLCYHKELDPDKVYRSGILDRINELDKNIVRKSYKGKHRLWTEAFFVAPYTTSKLRNIFKIGW